MASVVYTLNRQLRKQDLKMLYFSSSKQFTFLVLLQGQFIFILISLHMVNWRTDLQCNFYF